MYQKGPFQNYKLFIYNLLFDIMKFKNEQYLIIITFYQTLELKCINKLHFYRPLTEVGK